VVRAMPNTPCLIRHGMIALARGKHATDEDVALAKELQPFLTLVAQKYID